MDEAREMAHGPGDRPSAGSKHYRLRMRLSTLLVTVALIGVALAVLLTTWRAAVEKQRSLALAQEMRARAEVERARAQADQLTFQVGALNDQKTIATLKATIQAKDDEVRRLRAERDRLAEELKAAKSP